LLVGTTPGVAPKNNGTNIPVRWFLFKLIDKISIVGARFPRPFNSIKNRGLGDPAPTCKKPSKKLITA